MKNIVCQCNMVTEMEIKKAIIKYDAQNLADIQNFTSAGTRCGRCIPIIDELLIKYLKDKKVNPQMKLF